MKRLAFYGRVSTEDQQDPEASRGWQLSRARQLIEPLGYSIVTEFFDVGTSRSLPWKRRPLASQLLATLSDPLRGFEGVVIGEPQRAFYGNQFGLTFPVFTHFGVQLWVPEVGGAVDPGSEAHDLVMTLFGGMSKGERTRIQIRTRSAMMDLAERSDRFLGGRPPYGYRLEDAGPHPNPGRAAAGQRAHRLAVDQECAPTVQRIFAWYIQGLGLRAIAQRLTDEGVPSPSAHDRARNPHRDPHGWAFSAVRAILANETYTGRRVWAKQRKVEELVDPDDVAAGNQTRLRWRPEEEWVRPTQVTHPAVISDEVYLAVASRLMSRQPGTRRPRTTARAYPLQGLVFCTLCGRRMEGAWRPNKLPGSGRMLYRCQLHRDRALPADFAAHPKTLYVRETDLTGPIDTWIASMTTAGALAVHRDSEPGSEADRTLKSQLVSVEKKIRALVAAVESGADVPELTVQLKRRQAERVAVTEAIARAAVPRRATEGEIINELERLGGVTAVLSGAEPAERQAVYESLGIRVDYDHSRKTATVRADLACVFNRVRRGT